MAEKSEFGDPSFVLLLAIGLFLLICWIIWSIFEIQILEGLRYLRLAELTIINLFTHSETACIQWLWAAQPGEAVPSPQAWQAALNCFGTGLRNLDPKDAVVHANLSSESMGLIASTFGARVRWVGVGLVAILTYFVLFRTHHHLYRNRFTLEKLIEAQAQSWPVISPIVKFNPTKASARQPGSQVPDRLPLFAEPLSPEEWVSWNRIHVVNGIPDRDSVRRAFQAQLGPRWVSIKNVPPYMQALIVAFTLRGVQKRDESDALLGRIATQWSEKSGLVLSNEILAEVRKLLADPKVGGKAEEVMQAFAYRTTALLGLLKWARFMGGVLAPAYFLWLRAEDRGLWYALNNLGRRSFHSEGAGAIAHFMTESTAQKPLLIPRLETAIVTLNQYIAQTGTKIPPREGAKG